MTKTEARETIAIKTCALAREYSREITKEMIEEVLSEAGGGHWGEYYQRAAHTTTWRAVMKETNKY